MLCRCAVVAALVLASGAGSAVGSQDPFDAFLEAKRLLAERKACPAAESPSVAAPAVPPPVRDSAPEAAPAPAVATESLGASPSSSMFAAGPPEFRILGVVGSRGVFEAIVDEREIGRARIAAGDAIDGWKVVRVSLTEVELRGKGQERAVVPVGGFVQVRP